MDGSIQRRGDGWRVFVDAGRDPVTGRRRRLTGSAPTKRAAQELRNKFLAQVADGQVLATSATVAQLWAHYAAHGGPPSRAAKAAYESSWRLYLEPALGPRRLRSLNADVLMRRWSEMERAGLSPGTIDKAHTVISGMCAHAIRLGWLARNPAKDASPSAGETEEVDPVPIDQLKKAIALTEGSPLGLWLRLAAVTGARRGELCALQWGDFDRDGGRVFIRRRVTTLHEVLPATKNGRPRTPDLPERLWPVVDARRRDAEKDAAELGLRWSSKRFVFTHDPIGLVPWWPHSAGRAVRILAERHGLDGLRPHRIRHHAVTQMLARGYDVRTVAEVVGAEPTTILRVYAHYVPSRGKAAAEELGRLLEEED